MSHATPSSLASILPALCNLNIRTISKIIASKIIQNTALQLQFNSELCKQLQVSQYLNSYEAVAYFVDQRYFERYGFDHTALINLSDAYAEILADFRQVLALDLTWTE